MEESKVSPNDLIKLNIGGEKYVTAQRLTLIQAEGSLLEAMFRGTWEQSVSRDEEGNCFIDQSPSFFLPLLNYLRARRDENPNGMRVLPPKNLGSAFDAMVEHYNMTKFVYRLELRILSMPPPQDEIITNQQESWSISSPNDWVTVDLLRIGHNRKIKKYTVIMGKFKHARIGWRDLDIEYPAYDRSAQNRPISQAQINPSKGVGDFPGTIAFECMEDSFKSLYVNGGTSTADDDDSYGYDCAFPMEGIDKYEIDHVKEGTRIECLLTQPKERNDIYQGVKRPSWIVNGNQTDSFVTFTWAPRHVTPCISIQGSLQVTEIEYDTSVE